ncbi:MAG: T9SS type A sorting domain-containing protein, partial [Chitinophagales bacterium]
IESGCDDDYLILGDTVVGIEEVENGEAVFEVYPNPLKGSYLQLALSAEVALKADLVLEVYAVTGAKLLELPLVYGLRNQALEMGEMGLGTGLYVLQLKQEGKVLGRKKVVMD